MKRETERYLNVKSLKPTFKSTDNIEILILGTIPGGNAISGSEYYSENGNRFWHTLSEIFNDSVPKTSTEKSNFLKKYKIGLWDVLKSADRIIGSSKDTDIDNESIQFNDFSSIPTSVKYIIFNGTCNLNTNPKILHKKIRKHFEKLNIDISYCYSTSSMQKRYDQPLITQNWKDALNIK